MREMSRDKTVNYLPKRTCQNSRKVRGEEEVIIVFPQFTIDNVKTCPTCLDVSGEVEDRVRNAESRG